MNVFIGRAYQSKLDRVTHNIKLKNKCVYFVYSVKIGKQISADILKK